MGDVDAYLTDQPVDVRRLSLFVSSPPDDQRTGSGDRLSRRFRVTNAGDWWSCSTPDAMPPDDVVRDMAAATGSSGTAGS